MIDRIKLVLDVQGTQSPDHRDRGIARYIAEHALALDRISPGTIDHVLLNPRFTASPIMDPMLGSGRIQWNDRPIRGPLVFHVMSPFELTVPLAELWPQWARHPNNYLVVTLYDLIPHIFHERYLASPPARDAYESRLQLVRRADLILAISECTRQDAISRLGVDPERVKTIGGGVAQDFRPHVGGRAGAMDRLRGVLPELRPGFVFYTGGADDRKNMPGLIEAYSMLPASLKAAHQLVITCRLGPDDEAGLTAAAVRAGVADKVLLTNFVPEDVLLALYQATDLFVFPSLYEGFGLPIAEAMACGAPVIASDASSLPELVTDPDARFDPTDVTSIAAVMQRFLEDEDLRGAARARSTAGAPDLTWDHVAERTRAALSDLTRRAPVSASLTPLIALVSPYPPQLSGIASYTRDLADALAADFEVHVFVSTDLAKLQTPESPRVKLLPASSLRSMVDLTGYESVIYCMGNSEFHSEALEILRDVPGVVLAHDVRLAGLYTWRSHNGDPNAFRARLVADYGPRISAAHYGPPALEPNLAASIGIWMLGEILDHAQQVLVHSRFARDVVTLEAEVLGLPTPVRKVPFGFPPIRSGEHDPERPPVVVSFGLVAPVKRPLDLVDAFPAILSEHPTARLVFVGPAWPEAQEQIANAAERHGIGAAVEVVGEVPEDEYEAWLRRADVAVQMRAFTQGEASLTVAETLASGIPTIVTQAGWMAELPDDVCVKLPLSATPTDLADAIGGLLRDATRRQSMTAAARRYVAANSMEGAAAAIRDAIGMPGATRRSPAHSLPGG